MTPEIRYTSSGDVNIAYQVIGDGPQDLLVISGWISNLEVLWECPEYVRFVEYLAEFSRVILFDKRGTGLSDRVHDLPSLEVRMDDVRALLDAVGSTSATLFGWSEGAPMSCLFAATYPDRIKRLILASGYSRRSWAPDYPWGASDLQTEEACQQMLNDWGTPIAIESRVPSMACDPRFRKWWARMLRMSASAHDAVRLFRMNAQIDIRPILPVIRVPTLVIHSSTDLAFPIDGARNMASQIPGATMLELDDADHLPFTRGAESVLQALESLGLRGFVWVIFSDKLLKVSA
ncbi:alpha/beta fold hydrolase [Granulosicoccus sp. 3-233]|uniref:alpha/beta fold hydrolase n=1 Tax=Granulosicoccus sp. 3-233 TaxID=3417969 RepID=UPI003D358C03